MLNPVGKVSDVYSENCFFVLPVGYYKLGLCKILVIDSLHLTMKTFIAFIIALICHFDYLNLTHFKHDAWHVVFISHLYL